MISQRRAHGTVTSQQFRVSSGSATRRSQRDSRAAERPFALARKRDGAAHPRGRSASASRLPAPDVRPGQARTSAEASILTGVKANRKAHELNARALGELGPETASSSSALAGGWVINDDGALLLKSQLGTFDRPADMDLTGFEATHNHIHLDPQTSQASERIDLWAPSCTKGFAVQRPRPTGDGALGSPVSAEPAKARRSAGTWTTASAGSPTT